jgi:hypothetical protein
VLAQESVETDPVVRSSVERYGEGKRLEQPTTPSARNKNKKRTSRHPTRSKRNCVTLSTELSITRTGPSTERSYTCPETDHELPENFGRGIA